MKTKSTIRYVLSALTLALALTACTKNEESNESQEVDIVVAEPVIQEIQAVCDEPSLRNRLLDALRMRLLDDALFEVKNHDDAIRLGLEQQVRQKFADLDINIQSVSTSGAICRADVHFILPIQDIVYVNTAFENFGLVGLDEQAKEAGVALIGGNRLVIKDFAYTIENNKAVLGEDDATLRLVAKTLVASAYGMMDESHAQAQHTPTVRLEPVRPIITPRIQNQEESTQVHEVQPQQTLSQTQPPQPSSESLHTQEELKKKVAQPPKTEDSDRSKNTSANKKHPQQVTVPQNLATDDGVELMIIESNDTY